MRERPWEGEPDEAEWVLRGYRCVALRHPEMRHLCGYVEVAAGHPWHGAGAGALVEVDVHGGVTMACAGAEFAGLSTIEPTPDSWWVGFDCAHAWDLVPQVLELLEREAHPMETYRDFEYVKGECDRLAEQAQRWGRGGTP